jgi:Domain of unknown function (DUF397)
MERLNPVWRTSSYSGNGGANCVEAGSIPGAVLIRDTKDRERGQVLRLTSRAFVDFTSRIREDAIL